MAERRMFAKTIIDSDAFLDMPLSTQALYFHLSMRADDDGFINNAKKIQRMLGCADDDLKILLAKNFVIPFETGVCVIKHWKVHNYIQKDRYKETVYLEEKEKLSLKDNDVYTLDTQCIQNVSSLEAQVRLGKDSIGKDRLVNSDIPYQEIVDIFNKKLKRLPAVKMITEKRRSLIKSIWKLNEEYQSLYFYEHFFEKITKYNFLFGENNKNWKASFDWIFNKNNFVKIIEGNYERKNEMNPAAKALFGNFINNQQIVEKDITNDAITFWMDWKDIF